MIKAVSFLYFWGCTSFFLGTLVLLGPVRSLVTWIRSAFGSQSQEDLSVKIVLVVLVVVSALIAKELVRFFQDTTSRRLKWMLLLIPGLLAGGTMALWFQPRVLLSLLSKQKLSEASPFTFGPYPDESVMKRLKDEGYTAVVSLLHPAVLPFEPKLLLDEEILTEKIGIRLIKAPMVPWIGDNDASLNKIRELARSGTGKYYVHCYLGVDRVHVVKRMIENLGIPSDSWALGPARKLWEREKFERGAIVPLDEGIYMVPYPTDEEWFGYVLNGTIKTVVSLLDPQVPDEQALIAREREFLSKYQMNLVLLPVPGVKFDLTNIDEVVKRIRDLPKPVMVHEYVSASPRAKFVQKAFSHLGPSK